MRTVLDVLAAPEFFAIAVMAVIAILIIYYLQQIRKWTRMPATNSRQASLPTRRGTSRGAESLALVYPGFRGCPLALAVLWHLTRLAGLEVVAAKKDWNIETHAAYFLYKERLFLLNDPLRIALLGLQPDEALFAEVESYVQTCPQPILFLSEIAAEFRFLFVLREPPTSVLDKYWPDRHLAQAAPDRTIPGWW